MSIFSFKVTEEELIDLLDSYDGCLVDISKWRVEDKKELNDWLKNKGYYLREIDGGTVYDKEVLIIPNTPGIHIWGFTASKYVDRWNVAEEVKQVADRDDFTPILQWELKRSSLYNDIWS